MYVGTVVLSENGKYESSLNIFSSRSNQVELTVGAAIYLVLEVGASRAKDYAERKTRRSAGASVVLVADDVNEISF